MLVLMLVLARTSQLSSQANSYALALRWSHKQQPQALMALCSLLDLAPVHLYLCAGGYGRGPRTA